MTVDEQEWWRKIFSAEDGARIEERFAEIVSEETADNITIQVSIPKDHFLESLREMEYPTENAAHAALVAAMCLEYMENEALEPDMGCTLMFERVFHAPEDDDDDQ